MKRVYKAEVEAAPDLLKEATRLIEDAVFRLGWPRRRAEFVVRQQVKGVKPAAKATEKLAAMSSLDPKGDAKPTRRILSEESTPRRGGSPFLQGGSPGLGRRS